MIHLCFDFMLQNYWGFNKTHKMKSSRNLISYSLRLSYNLFIFCTLYWPPDLYNELEYWFSKNCVFIVNFVNKKLYLKKLKLLWLFVLSYFLKVCLNIHHSFFWMLFSNTYVHCTALRLTCDYWVFKTIKLYLIML